MKNCDLVEKNTNIYITTEREQATHETREIRLKSEQHKTRK